MAQMKKKTKQNSMPPMRTKFSEEKRLLSEHPLLKYFSNICPQIVCNNQVFVKDTK